MAKKAYIGVDGVARNIPKMYTGAYFGGSAGHTECIVSAAGSLLFTYANRNFKKSYDGDAYCASVIVNGWLAPLLVSQTAANVSYSTDGDYTSGPYGPSGTVTFRGATWYVSADGALFQTTTNPGGNVIHLNAITGVSSYSSLAEAALALLNYVNWLPAGDNIARKITKGYVGVNGVARPFFSKPERLYLYNEGDECVNVTGGWVVRSIEGDNYAERNADNLYITIVAAYTGAAWSTVNSFPVGGYTKIGLEIKNTSATGLPYATPIASAGLWTSPPSDRDNSGFYAGTDERTGEERKLLYVDLPQTTQNLFAAVYVATSIKNATGKIWLYKMWLE